MPKLLLLSYAFQPDNTPAAARPSQLFRYLPEYGVKPFVIAASQKESANPEAAVYRVPAPREPLWRRSASLAARIFMRCAAPYNDRLPWVPYAAAAAAKIIRQEKIDAVYSTSPFLASHMAAYWLKRHFGLAWIADFQDPVCDNPFRTRRWLYPYDRLLERAIFSAADRLIANTDVIAEVWRKRYPARHPDISVLWNSFDPLEPVADGKGQGGAPRILAHVGTLYGGRHPGQLLASLQRLGNVGLKVSLTGPIDEAVLAAYGDVFKEAHDGGILDYENALVPREEALRRTAAADCLLLLDVNARNTAFQVPSKLLDYIRIGKPILAYTPAASPVDRILKRSGIAHVSIAPDLPEALTDRKLLEFLELPLAPAKPSSWFLDNFSARHQAKTLADIVGGLLQDAAPARSGAIVMAGLRGAEPKIAAPAAILSMPPDQTPLLVTTVDAEEEFDWAKPLSRGNLAVFSMREQHVMHRLFDRFGVTPTYFVTYPILTQKDGYEPLLDYVTQGLAEVGAQLHPWVTPPFEEEVTPYNSFAGNLAPALEAGKLAHLTAAIKERFGIHPLSYRAGRYGIGQHSVGVLKAQGYRVDSSVVPEFGYHHIGGPAFFGYPSRPYWLDDTVLELPLTSATIGRLTQAEFVRGLFHDDGRYALSRSFMARSRLTERIRLTPEGTKVSDARRLVRALLKRGTRIFTLSYHTPSLVPGNTPYVRTAAEREQFVGWCEDFFAFFFGEIGGRPATIAEVYRLARQNREAPARHLHS